MSKLSFRARALDASKPMPIYLAEELPDLPDYSAINRAVPQMPSGMEKEEESEHHLQRAISGTGLIIPTPEVCEVTDLQFYERCYPHDYKMPKQHIHMQPLWEEQEAPEYDIDSEDERWLKTQRHLELTELKFEQMMDKLEKSSGQTVVTLSEAKLLLERRDDLVTAVYDYWLNKRLHTQHPLILSVKTENRPGQSSNNPYLAFRRRTEKMQTRKNRKNDESSYEKMLKLRRDLARALTLLELVGRREVAKREQVALTATLADKRYAAGDFANQLLPDPPPRPQYQPAPVPRISAGYRHYDAAPYPPRPPPTPVDQPRQREKRPYKKRKHRHLAVGAQGLRDSGVYTSSEEESSVRAEVASPPDDGPFAFRRKPGCYYEMPTSTLYGDPVDTDNPSKDGLFQHEIDPRHRFTLTSLRDENRCIGFARRRVGRGGRVLLDRLATPLDDLWPKLPFKHQEDRQALMKAKEEIETKAQRTPKEITRDYDAGGKYPWRRAFRQHLARKPQLWIEELKPEVPDLKPEENLKPQDVEMRDAEVKDEPMDIPQSVKSDISVNRTIDNSVFNNLQRIIRKRSWSGCSDSYDSDESLHPVEREFQTFINEVEEEWLHFRAKTPPPSPPSAPPEDQLPIAKDTPLAVELRSAEKPPSDELDTFTTSQFTLGDLYDLNPEENQGPSPDTSTELLGEEFTGLTEAQVESILSETDIKSLAEDLKDEKRLPEDILSLVGDGDPKGPFLLQGQGTEGRAGSGCSVGASALGSSYVRVVPLPPEPLCAFGAAPAPPKRPAPAPVPVPKLVPAPVPEPMAAPKPEPVPMADIIVEEVNEVMKVEKRKKDELIEEVTLPHGVQLKTVHTKHSPVKKHIITSVAHRRPGDVTLVTSHDTTQPQIVTVAVSDSLKVRLQNHLSSVGGVGGVGVGGVGVGVGGVVVQNGPFPSVAVALPVHTPAQTVNAAVKLSVAGVSGTGNTATASPRRVTAPLVHLAPASLTHKPLQLTTPSIPHSTNTPIVVAQSHTIHHVAPNKLKVLHAHPLTQNQRAQLLQTRGVPAVVSLAPLADARGQAAILKATPGSVAQFFEIKGGQIAKGPHLVNVLRQPAPKRVDDKRREVPVTAQKPQRVLGLDGRTLVRATIPTSLPVRPPRQQIQLKSRPFNVSEARVPNAVVANLLQKTAVQIPRAGPKIAISGPGGQPLSANVQAIAFTTAQLKSRQARLIPQPRPIPVAEIVEATTAPVATSSTSNMNNETPLEVTADGEEASTNGSVRRRATDTLPMEVT